MRNVGKKTGALGTQLNTFKKILTKTGDFK
jgi:hypothetical protein